VPRRDAQLARDLTKSEAEAAKAKHRGEAVEATIELRVCVDFINESELAIPPCSRFRKDAFDKGPRPLQLLMRELQGQRPASSWSRVRRQVLGVDVVRAVRASDC
jgi:hypothetical protein